MLSYIIRRLLYAIPILIGVNLITFALFFVVNPPDHMARLHLGNRHVTPASIDKWKSQRGYDQPLLYNAEKTYSAPFAVHLYNKETIEDAQGVRRWEYLSLNFGGKHLKYPARERAADIIKRAILGVVIGTILWTAIALSITAVLSLSCRERWTVVLSTMFRGKRELPWRSILGTLAFIVLFFSVSINTASDYHVFGTDKVGEDVLYQSLISIRTGLVIGTLATLVMLPFAILLGIMAGYFKGWVDDTIQYIYTTLNSIPGVLLIASAVLMMLVYMETHPQMFGTGVACRFSSVFFMHDSRGNELDRLMPSAASRNPETARIGICAGSNCFGGWTFSHPPASHPAQCNAYCIGCSGNGFQRTCASGSRVILSQYRC